MSAALLFGFRSTNSWCNGGQNSGITQICIITLWVSEYDLSFYEFLRVKGLRMSFRDVHQIRVTSQCALNAKRISLWSIQKSSVVFLCEFFPYCFSTCDQVCEPYIVLFWTIQLSFLLTDVNQNNRGVSSACSLRTVKLFNITMK